MREHRVTATVRFRITAVATLVVFAVLATAGIALVVTQQRTLTGNLDDMLRAQAARGARILARGDGSAGLAALQGDDLVVQLNRDGAVVYESENLTTRRALAELPAGDASHESTRSIPGHDEELRILSRRVRTIDGVFVLHVAAGTDDIHESTRALTLSLPVAIPLVVAFLAALIWWLVGRTLRPVESIRTNVAEISGTDLMRRVPVPDGDDEVARLARTMNAMLDRVAEARARQEQFVADASHELRSPLTRIRTELEVELARPGGTNLASTSESVLDEVRHLQRLVEDLLVLAELDARGRGRRSDLLDLDEIVLREAERLRSEGKVAIDTAAVSAAQVRGDRGQLTRLVRNVAENASRHARSTVRFFLAEQEGVAVLSVADDGAGIPPEAREHVFERFTRLDDARTATARRNGAASTGLGLAIARDIASRHEGTITIGDAAGGGCAVTVSVPLADSRSTTRPKGAAR
jgi:signal transduction histidine kinase